MHTFKLPQDFMFGTATASVQIEGGDTNNNWFRFCEEGKTKDKSHCIVAADHWNRYEEDIRLMTELNQQTYRMSIEWSRIEPSRGVYNEEAIHHYRDELQLLLKNHIRPLITIHHVTNPLWFEDMGGWANPDSIAIFKSFAEKAVLSFGDLVSDWVTINEPNVYLEGAYAGANFPPQEPSLKKYFRGARNMILAHIEVYRMIHRIRKEKNFDGKTLVGVAHHVRVFDPADDNPSARFACNLANYSFHKIFFEGMTNGKVMFPIGTGSYPLGKGKYSDFIGINYYTRDIVKFTWDPTRLFGEFTVNKGAKLNDMGWEIYPEGLYRLCKEYWLKYQLPVFILENGICDHEDKQRAKFIYDHFEMIKKLLDEGVPVERYYHWSLIDNFEWDEGLTPRFGLIEVDYETQKRTIRKSGYFYGELTKNKGITEEMLRTYFAT
ncbi:MAG: glycoside hydrolase family 1 protein [Bacillota bacterium]